MSPIAAMKVAAVCTLTPGTVISRSTSGQASACLAISRSSAAISTSRKSTWRRQPSSVSRSSSGSSSPASQRRPPLPKASVTGGRSHRLRASTPCASFFARVRARTIRSRRLVSRRSARVRSSGVQTVVEQPGDEQPRQRPRVQAIGLGLRLGDRLAACACWRPRRGSRGACSTETIRSVPVVASSATTSSAARLCANSSSAGTRVAIRPAERTSPSRRSRPRRSRGAHPARTLASLLLSSTMSGSAAGHTTATDSCSQHTGASRRGGHEQRRARSSSVRSACPSASPNKPHVPGARMLPAGPDGSFIPRQRAGLRRHAPPPRLPALRVRHLRTRPYRPRTNGKAERFIQTMTRRWAYGRTYNTSDERTAALPGWLKHYNHHDHTAASATGRPTHD